MSLALDGSRTGHTCGTLMRHFLTLTMLALTISMTAGSLTCPLVASSRPTKGLSARRGRANATAVAIATIAVRTDHRLTATAPTKEDPERRLERGPGRRGDGRLQPSVTTIARVVACFCDGPREAQFAKNWASHLNRLLLPTLTGRMRQKANG